VESLRHSGRLTLVKKTHTKTNQQVLVHLLELVTGAYDCAQLWYTLLHTTRQLAAILPYVQYSYNGTYGSIAAS